MCKGCCSVDDEAATLSVIEKRREAVSPIRTPSMGGHRPTRSTVASDRGGRRRRRGGTLTGGGAEGVRVARDDEAAAGAGESDVHTPATCHQGE